MSTSTKAPANATLWMNVRSLQNALDNLATLLPYDPEQAVENLRMLSARVGEMYREQQAKTETGGKWESRGTPPELQRAWAESFGGDDPLVAAPTVHTNGELEAFVGREPVGPHQAAMEDLRWHISVRGRGRVPTWEEMVDAAHSLRPGVVFCIPMPPKTWWLNVHEHVLHLWEIRDPNMENQWRAEANARRPQTPPT